MSDKWKQNILSQNGENHIYVYEAMGGKIIAERKSSVNNIDLIEHGLTYSLIKNS